MSSPKVTYSYANGSANTIRPTSVTYPDNTGGTRVLTYDYGTAGGMNDKLSRVESLGFGGPQEVEYGYLGLGTFVIENYIHREVAWNLATGTVPNPYAGLDRFGRVIRNYWYETDGDGPVDDIRYTYDRASNRTTRENTVAKAQTTPQYFDELYGYDGSNRLTQMQRGQLAGTTSITNLQFVQDSNLDPTGNWQQFNEDSNGSGTNDLVQARTANPVNEITDITNSVGTPWVQPGYDAAGNMTTIPQGNEPEAGFTGVYDAWNRLVKLRDEDDNVVAEYAYDGLTRRIKKTTAAETRHYLYNASWQILEERVGSATTYDRQYVWGLRYIDDCVLRDRKLTSSVERLYVMQDANWNVTALMGSAGSVVERFSYSAYGVPSFLSPDFTVKADSDYAWDVLYAGYKWDGESGMYQVRYRYLLPTLGCWISRDPLNYITIDAISKADELLRGMYSGKFVSIESNASRMYLDYIIEYHLNSILNDYIRLNLGGNSLVQASHSNNIKSKENDYRNKVYEQYNLYCYVNSSPVNDVDPYGLIPWAAWIWLATKALWYGEYCGPGSTLPGPGPIDGLDRCCQNHDNCYARVGAEWWRALPGCGTPQTDRCDTNLCNCAKAFNCNPLPVPRRIHCLAYQTEVVAWFC